MSSKATQRRVQIDYHPHRINSTGSSIAPVVPDAVELPTTSVGESYDLGDVMSFDSEDVSTDESRSRETFV